MKVLAQSELKQLSFPDSKVENMEIDFSKHIVNIEVNSGYLCKNTGVRLPACKIIIKQWSSLTVRLYRASTEEWEKVNINEDMEKLIDICEFVYGEDIVFRGVGKKSGQWLELVFSKAIAEVNVMNED